MYVRSSIVLVLVATHIDCWRLGLLQDETVFFYG